MILPIMNTGTEMLLNVNSKNIDEVGDELLPLECYNFSYTYIISENDINATEVTLAETGSRIGITSAMLVEETNVLNVNLTRPPVGALRLLQSFSYQESCANVGQVVMITVTVENVGLDVVNQVVVQDSLIGTNYVCSPMGTDNTIDSIFPNDVFECTGAYMFMGSDISVGINPTLTANVVASGNLGFISTTITNSETFPGPDTQGFVFQQGTGSARLIARSTVDFAFSANPTNLVRNFYVGCTTIQTNGCYSGTGSRFIDFSNFAIHPQSSYILFGIGSLNPESGPVQLTTSPARAWENWTFFWWQCSTKF